MTVTPATLTPFPARDPSQIFTPYGFERFPLDDHGYITEEWVATGEALGHHYRTVVCVRRPSDMSTWSGTVIAEPFHYSGIAPVWMYASGYVMRNHHVWVCIAAQKQSLEHHHKGAKPDRYSSCHIDGESVDNFPLSPPFEQEASMRDFWGRLARINVACSTILAQVGAALRTMPEVFGGRNLQHIVLTGHSQTGNVNTAYINTAHTAERLADGSSVYDGYFPSGYPLVPLPDIDRPIVQVLCEGDVPRPDLSIFPGADRRGWRRDDAPLYRLYELAGVPHMTSRQFPYSDTSLWAGQHPSDVPLDTVMSSMPHCEMFNACLHRLVRWVVDGVVPPSAPRLEFDAHQFIAKDEFGNAIGGVRSPQLDVPAATHYANVPRADGTPSVVGVGADVAFSPERVRDLYGTADEFRRRFEARLDQLIAEGWFLAEDDAEVRPDATKPSFS